MPERAKGWFRKYYPKYGHSRKLIETAMDLGRELGQDYNAGQSSSELQFETPVSVKSQ